MTDCISVDVWGDFGTRDGAPTDFGGEAAGFVKAGAGGLTFPGSPAGGDLIIAYASRFHMNSGSVPPTGTISGFGATWDLISSQSATGNGSAGFTEVYRAQQPSYTVPDFMRYDFPAGSTGDHIYSTVGYIAYSGVNPVGLADNGASTILNITQHGPTSGFSPADYTQGALGSFESSSSVWFNRWQSLINSGNSDGFFWNEEGIVENAFGWASGTRSTVPPPPQWGVADAAHTREAGVSSQWTWEPGQSRTWWAASLEIRADPECILDAYWGIDVTLVI